MSGPAIIFLAIVIWIESRSWREVYIARTTKETDHA